MSTNLKGFDAWRQGFWKITSASLENRCSINFSGQLPILSWEHHFTRVHTIFASPEFLHPLEARSVESSQRRTDRKWNDRTKPSEQAQLVGITRGPPERSKREFPKSRYIASLSFFGAVGWYQFDGIYTYPVARSEVSWTRPERRGQGVPSWTWPSQESLVVCVYMHICIYIYIHDIYIYTHGYMYINVYTRVYIYMDICM